MKLVKTVMMVILALVALAVVLPFLIPVKSYIPRLERVAANRLGEPVSIGNLQLRLLPAPAVGIQDIRIGPSQEVRIGSVTIHPDLWTLIDPVKVLRRVEVDGLTLDRPTLGRLAHWSQADEGPKTLLVRHVEARNLSLALGDVHWGPLRAEAWLDTQGLRRAELGTQDRSLQVDVVPEQARYALEIRGHNWTLPVKPALRFGELKAEGKLDAAGLELPQIQGKLYGGELKATTRVEWRDGVRLQGDARATAVQIEPIVRLLGQSASMSGLLDADGHYTLAAPDASRLADGVRGSFRFEVRKGVLYNFDLASAVRALAREGTRGGQTTFNEFTGTVHLLGRQVRLRDLKIASGLLQAQGDVDVAPDRRLSGRVRVAMKGTASLVSVPLEVAGTLQDPVLFPDRAALAGAAVGTGLMGPGLGTTVGAKAGEALGRLFR